MTNSNMLKSLIKDSGVSLTYIAGKLGITRYAIYKKLDNKSEFKASEIVALKKVLHLTNEQVDEIFFNE